MDEQRTLKRKYQAPPPLTPYSPPRPNPLQSLLNPFRNLFSLGSKKVPPTHRNKVRRIFFEDPEDEDQQLYAENADEDYSSVPAPLPPPVDFPDFHESNFPTKKKKEMDYENYYHADGEGLYGKERQEYTGEGGRRQGGSRRNEGVRRPDSGRRPEGGRRKRKRPRRPLIDDSIKYQYKEEMGNYIKPNDKIRFRDLLDSKR